ncbi:MAG TPA: ribokinase [Rhodanobacteraceae bacterium]|nr:ribokinase [Rhodanobacteraceae bacterium]
MSTQPRVVVVGSYNHDHIWRVDRFPRAGETRLGNDFQVGAGGKGFNQAVASRRQGADTLFVGAIGDDHVGASARRIAEEAELDCRWQVASNRPTAATCVLVDGEGRNEIVVNPAANEALSPAFVAGQADALGAGGVLLVQMETPLATVREALRLAGEAGMVRVLNPAPVHADADASLLAQCDVLTPNETEFAQLLVQLGGRSLDADQLAGTGDAALHALCRTLAVPTVIVTLGAHGCFVSHADAGGTHGDDASYYRVAAEAVRPVDTTGAGDAFNGALAAAMLRLAGQSLRTMVAAAGRAAALSTERRGASAAMATLDEVRKRFS